MTWIGEFFEDSDGRKSMHRLISFGVFIVGAIVMIILAIVKALTVSHFGIWIGSGGLTYATGKVSDIFDKTSPTKGLTDDRNS